MAIHITDPVADKAVRELARHWDVSLTEAIRRAAERQLAAERRETNMARIVAELQAAANRYAPTDQAADKAFFDSLNDE